jgi:hypothetical protein
MRANLRHVRDAEHVVRRRRPRERGSPEGLAAAGTVERLVEEEVVKTGLV